MWAGNTKCNVHIFYNEKAELEQRHKFLAEILRLEKTLVKCKSKEEFNSYIQNHLPDKYHEYFQWNPRSKNIEKNILRIDEHLANLGYFLISTNEKLDKTAILEHYRNRDIVEKLFDIMKNEMDGSRLRVHSSYNADGKLFVKFIALIIYMQITNQMKKNKLFDKYSLKEMLNEFKKIKITHVEHFDPIISELTKRNKKLFEELKLRIPA